MCHTVTSLRGTWEGHGSWEAKVAATIYETSGGQRTRMSFPRNGRTERERERQVNMTLRLRGEVRGQGHV